MDRPGRDGAALSVPYAGPSSGSSSGSPGGRPAGLRRGRIDTRALRRPRAMLVAVAAAVVVAAVVVALGVVAGSSGGAPEARQRASGAPVNGEPAHVVSGIPSAPGIPSASSGASAAGPAPSQHTTRGTAGATAAIPFQQATPTASDQFAGSTLDLSQWGEYDATQDNGSSWAASADRVTGGELQIVGTGTNPSGAGNVSGGVCWGCHGAGHRYGVWQVRARFDAGSGYAPVIGLWPSQGSADNQGWLTVVNIPQPARTSSGYAVRGPDGTSIDGTVGGSLTGWHTYTIEWRSNYVKMYLDGTLIVDTTTNATHVTVPSVPMYLYIQQETGPTDSVPAPNGTTPAQVITHVDWVKYFG